MFTILQISLTHGKGKSPFFFFFNPYMWCTDDSDETRVSRAQAMGRMPWFIYEIQGFWIAKMLPPRDLLWCLSKTWPTDQRFATGRVLNQNEGKFLSQVCNSLHFENLPFFVGRKHLLSRKLHQNTTSSACWISFTFVHWVSTESDKVKFQSIAQSQ